MQQQPTFPSRAVRVALATAAAIAVLLSSASPGEAQEGPPPHVRRAIDAVLALIGSDGEAALAAFVDDAMVPDPDRDRGALLERLRALRDAARGLDDSVAVERAPDGVRVILSSGGRREQILVALTPDGVVDLRRVEPAPGTVAGAPTSRDAAIRRHAQALETSNSGTPEEALRRLERDAFAPTFLARTTPGERAELVAELRRAADDAGDVRLGESDGRLQLTLQDRRVHEVQFTLEEGAPWRIETLTVASRDVPGGNLELTRDNVVEEFERLEREGLSGIVYIRLGGEVLLQRAFGMANEELGIPMSLDTVFGTGSRPIDYTVAAIYLLAQRGRLTIDDTIDRHFDGVPPDKRAITIRQLLTGRSGLPDFFHTADDWDADLAWIDRDMAVRRMMAQPLLFAPGSGHRHSHGAFVLLAALIERVSGDSYADFLRTNLFEPAGLTRTGFYGETRGLGLRDFAVGHGPSSVGLPNIPPNWGPTSWLVMGSGGMFSTLGDLRKFYDYLRSDGVLEERFAARFDGFLQLDGSDRGFELFHAYTSPDDEAILMLNHSNARPEVHELIRAVRRLAAPGIGPD